MAHADLHNRIARRSDWTTKPMSAKRTRIPVELHYSPAEMGFIRRGFIPQVMDEKWFIFFENQTLHFHRSWTGYEILRAQFHAQEGEYVVREIVACRDPELYKQSDDDYDVSQFQFLIDLVLLRDASALDKWQPGGAGPLGALNLWTVAGKAMFPPAPVGESAGGE
ncbi:MAG: hypothetical protein U0452_12950 [Anaerolineae bacterium]